MSNIPGIVKIKQVNDKKTFFINLGTLQSCVFLWFFLISWSLFVFLSYAPMSLTWALGVLFGCDDVVVVDYISHWGSRCVVHVSVKAWKLLNIAREEQLLFSMDAENWMKNVWRNFSRSANTLSFLCFLITPWEILTFPCNRCTNWGSKATWGQSPSAALKHLRVRDLESSWSGVAHRWA